MLLLNMSQIICGIKINKVFLTEMNSPYRLLRTKVDNICITAKYKNPQIVKKKFMFNHTLMNDKKVFNTFL